MRLRYKGKQAEEWLTLISVLVSTAGGAQRHPGGQPRFLTGASSLTAGNNNTCIPV